MPEYAFDIKLWAVARVGADTEEEARAKLSANIHCVDLGFDRGGVKITEASIEGSFDLFEIDGKELL